MSIISGNIRDIVGVLDAKKNNMSPVNIENLNRKRGETFRRFMIQKMMSDELGLTPIDNPDHPPLYDTGYFAENSEVRVNGEAVNVGYFSDNSEGPEGAKITYTDIAILQTTGFNVKHRIIPPRPFMDIALRMYKETSIDKKIISNFIKGIKPEDDNV